jgi:hypothetical protein
MQHEAGSGMIENDGGAIVSAGWRRARIEDLPALPPTDDPDLWRPWTRDPDFSQG